VATKFMDKREAQFMHDSEKVFGTVTVIADLELIGIGRVLY
jgi:hypothetical protein